MVASIIQSSSFVERRVADTAGARRANVLVELGPGTGDMTRALLAALPDNARLIAIERTGEFLPALEELGDSRLEAVHGCASDIGRELDRRGLATADAIVSGIPFAYLPPALAGDIVAGIRDSLAPGGRFVAYQITGSVAGYMTPLMGPPTVEWEFRNVPPLRIFSWQKPEASAESQVEPALAAGGA